MNLLGLMLGEVISSNLATPKGAALAQKLSGAMGITAGRMSITLIFAADGVVLKRGLNPPMTSQVKGSLNNLLKVSLGESAISAFLKGRVSFSGNPIFLLRMVSLMQPSITSSKETL